ncbi:MAG TPA: hypothetical protein VF303_02000 [Candidatus Nanoarchaeia archaeon]
MVVLLALTFLLAAASWIFSAYIVWYIPPKIDNALVISNLVYFFLFGTLALALTASLVFYLFGSFFQLKIHGVGREPTLKRLFLRSARRGFLLALLISATIALNVFNLLNLLNAALVIGIILLAEIYFSGR